MHIQNWRRISIFKGCNPLKLLLGLIGNYHAIANFAYASRWQQGVIMTHFNFWKLRFQYL